MQNPINYALAYEPSGVPASSKKNLPPEVSVDDVRRGSDWEEWIFLNGTRVRNIYSSPKFVWNPLNNSWCDYLYISNSSGYYIATSQIWAHLNLEGDMLFFSPNFTSLVGILPWKDWSNKKILTVERKENGIFITQRMFRRHEQVIMNVTYGFTIGNPLKLTFSMTSLKGVTNFQLDWRIEGLQSNYFIAKGQVLDFSTSRKYDNTNYTYFYGDKALSNFRIGLRWEDAWQKYVRTTIDIEGTISVTFGNFNLSKGQVVTLDPSIATLSPSADATVVQGAPNQNYGTSSDVRTMLYKDEFGTIWRRRFFMKFSMSSLPSGIHIKSAKMFLYLYSSSSHYRWICCHRASSDSWDETTITWNNKPSYASSSTAEVFVGTSSDWYSWDVTNDGVAAYNSSSKLFSECFKDKQETQGVPYVPYSINKLFYSKDYTGDPNKRPYLQVVYENKYAVLIAGGWNAYNNHARYWNDLMFMYDTLTDEYDYTSARIYVLYADGDTPNADNCHDYENAVDHSDVIDYSATTSNLQNVFSTLASNMENEDFLFVFTTDHGDSSDGHSYLVLWDQTLRDDTFAGSSYLGAVTTYHREAIVMEQCYSGGFIDDVSGNKRATMTACDYNELSYACDTEGHYDEFVYHWISAVNGANPDGTPVDADANDDGMVSMREAYNYAESHDNQDETPQYDDPGNIGDWAVL